MPKSKPSSNWLALKKQLPSKKRKLSAGYAVKKRRKEDVERPSTPSSHFSASAELSTLHSVPSGSQNKVILQQMVLGQLEYSEAQKESGKYLALDCEMVGVGIDGSESSLARVSLVNFHGAVILDEYVRQKERVVDYRTQWSGIRPNDLVNGQSFEVVQKHVATLLKGKVLVGHAVFNDLKVLLLSHPRPKTRDTQYYAYKFGVCKSGRIALRDLVKQELGLTIQSGEHSSVTDARATMAVYRLHQRAWEKGVPHNQQPSTSSASKKESHAHVDRDTFSHGKLRKGISSGLSTVSTRRGGKYVPRVRGQTEVETKTEWWMQLPTPAIDQGSLQTLDRDAEVGYTNISDWTGFQEWPDSDQ